tara:strand:- start:21322 stop:21663 length:342 start_codon:yes stop_codon:yes gene_type:complete
MSVGIFSGDGHLPVNIPFQLLVRVLEVHVREDVTGKRTVGTVGNKSVNSVSKVLVGALEGIREVPALVALMALGVFLDVTSSGPEDVFILLHGNFVGITTTVGVSSRWSRVAS